MSVRRSVFIGAALVAAAAIVVVSTRHSSPPSQQSGEGARPSAELLPFTWHDEPRDIPDLVFIAKDGSPVPIGDFRGRTLLINLWATWCAPCLREMPMLDRLALATAGAGFEVIALNQERGGLEAALPYWQEHGFTGLSLYLDDGLKSGRALAATGLPLTVFVDAEGRELARLEGVAEWDHPDMIAYFSAFTN
ncbi:MAG: TlpA disulfide reductase family protein [Alphaproteobacteria bacterium]